MTLMNKLTTSQAAKLLKIHPDTLRRRAKAGKVAFTLDVNGHMQFDSLVIDMLVAAVKGAASAPIPISTKHNRTKTIFVIDRSGSMGGFEQVMVDCMNKQIETFKAAADASNTFQLGSISFHSDVSPFTGFEFVNKAVAPTGVNNGFSTALYDAMGVALRFVQRDMQTDPQSAYLIVIITDGGENSSRIENATTIGRLVKDLVATDRVTVAANVPPNHTHHMTALNVPKGNVLEWEGSMKGFSRMTFSNVDATQSYVASRSAGITSSTAYYANLQGDPNKVAQDLNKKLDEVTKDVSVERVGKSTVTIRKFAEDKFGGYVKGTIFYELKKKETVQPYKGIIVQDTATGKFFKGHDAAKKMLGIVPGVKGDIKVAPGNLGEFKVFVQSTSYNRKLPPNSTVVKLP